jgi:hypothetical protein
LPVAGGVDERCYGGDILGWVAEHVAFEDLCSGELGVHLARCGLVGEAVVVAHRYPMNAEVHWGKEDHVVEVFEACPHGDTAPGVLSAASPRPSTLSVG